MKNNIYYVCILSSVAALSIFVALIITVQTYMGGSTLRLYSIALPLVISFLAFRWSGEVWRHINEDIEGCCRQRDLVWKKTSDCMPEEGEQVLACGVSMYEDGFCDICVWDGEDWYFNGGQEVTDGITYWMPLPDEPKQLFY